MSSYLRQLYSVSLCEWKIQRRFVVRPLRRSKLREHAKTMQKGIPTMWTQKLLDQLCSPWIFLCDSGENAMRKKTHTISYLLFSFPLVGISAISATLLNKNSFPFTLQLFTANVAKWVYANCLCVFFLLFVCSFWPIFSLIAAAPFLRHKIAVYLCWQLTYNSEILIRSVFLGPDDAFQCNLLTLLQLFCSVNW